MSLHVEFNKSRIKTEMRRVVEAGAVAEFGYSKPDHRNTLLTHTVSENHPDLVGKWAGSRECVLCDTFVRLTPQR